MHNTPYPPPPEHPLSGGPMIIFILFLTLWGMAWGLFIGWWLWG